MSAHSHDDHHSTEAKPVAFTVPMILGGVTILITVLFLSLCDPKPHGHGHENAAHAKFEGEVHNPNAGHDEVKPSNDAATSTTMDTMHTKEATPAEAHEHGDAHEHH